MRILATAKWAEAKGGAERSVLDVSGGLSARGHDVTVLYQGAGELLPEYQRRGCSTVHGFEFFIDRNRHVASTGGFAWTWLRGVRQRPELVYIQDWEHAPLGAAVSSSCRAPLVSHLRLTPPPQYSRQHRSALRRVDRFIAVSSDVRERFVTSGLPRDRIDVVHNGLDLDEFSPGAPADREAVREALGVSPDDFVVLYVGRLDRVKGVETLIAACNRRAELGRPVRLVAVGQPIWHQSDSDGQDYLERLRDLAKPTQADFVGARTDIVPMYRAADVVVVPSIWPEPFGRVVIEAMACGRAVIASRVGGIPEILTGDLAPLLFEPGDVDDLVRRLDEIENDAASIGIRCRTVAEERFGIGTTLDGVEASLADASRHAGRRETVR